MPHIVHAVAGEKVQNASAVGGEQFRPDAALVAHIHFEQVQKAHPFWINSLCVALRRACPLIDMYCNAHKFFFGNYGVNTIEAGVPATE